MSTTNQTTRTFHHVGLRAMHPQPGENFVEATRVWVTDPNARNIDFANDRDT